MSGYGISSTDIVSMSFLSPTPPLHVGIAEAFIDAFRAGHGLRLLCARRNMSKCTIWQLAGSIPAGLRLCQGRQAAQVSRMDSPLMPPTDSLRTCSWEHLYRIVQLLSYG